MVNSSTNQLNVKLRNTSTILDSLNIDVSNLIDNIHFIAINVTHSGSGTSHSYSFDIYVDGAFKGTVSGVNNLEMDNISFLSRLGDNQFEGQLSSVIINTNEHFTSDKIQDYYKRLKLIYDNNDVYQDDFDMVINGNTSSYDMINFHNNFNSFNGVKPTTQLNNPNITDISENFEYVDDVIESGVGNYVYALKNQTLTYNFSQTNSGMIGTKYKPISGKSMTIMELVGTTGLDISIYCYGSSVLYATINGTQYVIGSQNIDSWNTIIVSWSKVVASSSLESDAFTVKIYLNGVSKINQSISTTSSITNMLVSVGKTTTSTSTTNGTMGYIEKLVYDTNNISDTTASTIHTLLNTNYYCKNTYDDFSRKSSKEVLTEGNVKIKNNYSFKLSQSVYETNQLDKEVLNISGYNWETRTYTFDDYGSVTNVSIFTNSDGITKNKAYTYSKGQLISESDGTNTFTYNYDGRGNLTSIAQNGTTNKTFTYSNDGLKLTNVNSNTIEYEGLFPKYYKNSSSTILKEYVFEGRRLSQLIDYENDRKYYFYYNVSGLRESMKVSQISTGYLVTATYFYYNSDNQLMFEDRLTYVDNEFDDNNIMSYMYDHNGELYGFKYNNTPYYYLRDALGNINAILSSSGSLVAKYEYDAWGNHKVLSSSGDENTSTTFIGNINSFRYKGYYFDYETQLFYCNSRYYSPELCRWISPDSIEYLDPESINGLNLYAYCGNDPINKYDPSGHFAIATAVAIGFWIGFGIGAVAGATAGGIIAYEYCVENDISGWGMAGLMTLGILGGGYIGGAIGGAIGSAIGYGVGIAFGGTQALVEGASIALYSGGGSSAAYNAAVASGKMLIRETFAAKTLTFAQTIYPILKLKPIYNTLWGKLSYDFALGASSAEIFLNGSGIYEKSAFYCYEIWALLERGVERIISYV